jgi:hypothetical protein
MISSMVKKSWAAPWKGGVRNGWQQLLHDEPWVWDSSNISKYGRVQRNSKTSSECNSLDSPQAVSPSRFTLTCWLNSSMFVFIVDMYESRLVRFSRNWDAMALVSLFAFLIRNLNNMIPLLVPSTVYDSASDTILRCPRSSNVLAIQY